MSIGNLDVTVTATTGQAVNNLRNFQREVRSTGRAVKETAGDFHGNSIADFEKMYGGGRPAKVALPKFDDASIVDLRGEFDQINQRLERAPGLVKNVNAAMREFHHVVRAASAAFVFIEAVHFGQEVRAHIDHIHSWGDAWRELKSVIGLGKSGEEEELEHMDRVLKRHEERLQKMNQELEQRKGLNKEYDETRQRLADEAKFGREGAAYRADVRKFSGENPNKDQAQHGASQAYALMLLRSRVAEREETAAQYKRKEEERINALVEQRRKYDQDQQQRQEAARRNWVKDQGTVRDLQREVTDYWKTASEKRESKVLAGIEDPRQRQQAQYAFMQLRAADRVRGREEDKQNRRTRAPADALDARTKEGWAALRANLDGGPQQMLLKENQKHTKLAETANGYLAKLSDGLVVEVVKM